MTPRTSSNLSGPRKMTVRLALATGATMATLLGAQSLSLLERATGQTDTSVADTSTQVATQPAAGVVLTVTPLAPTIPPAAPKVVIIRNPGAVPTAQPATQKNSGTSPKTRPASSIKPPQAVVAPAAVAVQPASGQPAPATSSSR